MFIVMTFVVTKEMDGNVTLSDLLSEMKDMRLYFDNKLDKLKNELMVDIDLKVSCLKNEFSKTLNELEAKVVTMETRISNFEHNTRGTNTHERTQERSVNNSEITVFVRGLPEDQDESLYNKIDALLLAVGPNVHSNVKVVDYTRLPSRNSAPGLVKIAFENLNQKKLVLNSKFNITDSRFQRVFINSSKPHIERVLQNNMKTILNLIPEGRQYRFTGSGKIVRKDDSRFTSREARNSETKENSIPVTVSPSSVRYRAVVTPQEPPRVSVNMTPQSMELNPSGHSYGSQVPLDNLPSNPNTFSQASYGYPAFNNEVPSLDNSSQVSLSASEGVPHPNHSYQSQGGYRLPPPGSMDYQSDFPPLTHDGRLTPLLRTPGSGHQNENMALANSHKTYTELQPMNRQYQPQASTMASQLSSTTNPPVTA